MLWGVGRCGHGGVGEARATGVLTERGCLCGGRDTPDCCHHRQSLLRLRLTCLLPHWVSAKKNRAKKNHTSTTQLKITPTVTVLKVLLQEAAYYIDFLPTTVGQHAS